MVLVEVLLLSVTRKKSALSLPPSRSLSLSLSLSAPFVCAQRKAWTRMIVGHCALALERRSHRGSSMAIQKPDYCSHEKLISIWVKAEAVMLINVESQSNWICLIFSDDFKLLLFAAH